MVNACASSCLIIFLMRLLFNQNIQANIFARAFLPPSSVRRIHTGGNDKSLSRAILNLTWLFSLFLMFYQVVGHRTAHLFVQPSIFHLSIFSSPDAYKLKQSSLVLERAFSYPLHSLHHHREAIKAIYPCWFPMQLCLSLPVSCAAKSAPETMFLSHYRLLVSTYKNSPFWGDLPQGFQLFYTMLEV